ncbi:MAG: hypothetical protein B6I24_10675 [Bacteroidetes bacterium 4572_128]|nr:MAG: hypothetical protein B6I24_10675 [Bacteroidetes bacterium 4572_128]
MENLKKNIWKSTMESGGILGFVLILFSYVLYLQNTDLNSEYSWFSFVILIAGIVLGTKKYTKENPSVIISYKRTFFCGVLISFFSAFILGFYNFILFEIIDTELMHKIIVSMEEELIITKMTEEQIEMISAFYKKIITPTIMAFGTLFSMTFLGTIFSLITAHVLKTDNKIKDPFDKDMKNI